MGESVVTKRVHRNFPIMLPNRVTHVEVVEIYTFNFDVIFCLAGFMLTLPL